MQEILTSANMAFSMCPLLNQGAVDMLLRVAVGMRVCGGVLRRRAHACDSGERQASAESQEQMAVAHQTTSRHASRAEETSTATRSMKNAPMQIVPASGRLVCTKFAICCDPTTTGMNGVIFMGACGSR